MHPGLKMHLEYARVWQLTFTFAIAFAIYVFSKLPHTWWVLVTVLIISAAYEPGLVVKKSLQRGKGTIIGLILAGVALSLLEFNFRYAPLVLVVLASISFAFPPTKYAIQVTCITMFIFIGSSFSPNESSFLQEMVARMINTIIGICICMSGDFLLFTKFQYSRRNYAIMQREICLLMHRTVNQLVRLKDRPYSNMRIQNIRESYSIVFAKIAMSGDSIQHDFRATSEAAEKIKKFNDIIWEMRTETAAISYCILLSKDHAALDRHVKRFETLLTEAKTYYIKKTYQGLSKNIDTSVTLELSPAQK
ncbi:FUSC family protein [Francisellaceae bacterium]|nr:FUSC family protein [Francisellaceae bacterium]